MKIGLVSVVVLSLLSRAVAAREKVIYDTDIGGDVDDAMALAYLLRNERCDLLGVTIEAWGTNGLRQAEIASAICRDFGRNVRIPIGPGAGNLLARHSGQQL